MKKNDLENKALIITYFILALVLILTCCTFFSKCQNVVDPSSSIAEVIEVTTASLDVSTETTESTVETSSDSTKDETTSCVETTIEEVTQEQETDSSTEPTTASTNVTTKNSMQAITTYTNSTSVKTAEEIAKEVLQGKWGDGYDRKNRLEASGYNYEEIQNIVKQYTTTVVTTTTIKTTTTSTVITTTTIASTDTSNGTNKQCVKTFSRGTYYAYGGARRGGSGRDLIDCSIGNGTVKGSIASSYLYRNYGYNYNGSRTMVYLEIQGYSSMNGYYYLDDSDAGNPNVIDFFYYSGGNCQFCRQGVVQVDCYIVK